VTLADEIDSLLPKRRLLTTNLRCVKYQKGEDLSGRFNIFCFALDIATVAKSSNMILATGNGSDSFSLIISLLQNINGSRYRGSCTKRLDLT
jgi:hypothetical protein